MLPSHAAAHKLKDKAKAKCFSRTTIFPASEDWYIYYFNSAVKGSKDALKIKVRARLPVETMAINCGFSDASSARY